MTTLGRVLRCLSVQRAGRVLEIGSRGTIKRNLRAASTVSRPNIVEGQNGEKIVPSIYGDVNYPEVTVPEYVWRDFNKYLNHTALECGITGRRYSYAQARDTSHYFARSLRNLGFQDGDVIALVAPNLPETILAFLGILEAGLVVTTVNPFCTVDEIARQLTSSDAKGIVTAAEIAPGVQTAANKVVRNKIPFIVIEDGTGPAPDGTIPFKDVVEKGRELPPLSHSSRSPNDLAILPYSSGTTGLPKGVMLSHTNLVSNVEMVQKTVGEELWRPTTRDFQEVIPAILPFFHIFGMNGVTLPQLSTGAKLITLPKFTPDTFLSVMEKSKPTVLFCVPPIVLFLSASPNVKKSHIENIHAVFSGAAPLAEADVERVYDKFNISPESIKFCQGYGLTESSPVTFVEKHAKKYSSIGKNVCGCTARLVDPVSNEDVSKPGQTGELWVKGPNVMKGYYKNETATRDTITEDGWLKTGDIAYYDEDLDFFITDRLKELIKVKGFQVAPAELEALLRTHPDVAEAAVIGVPDPRSGEVPKAFVLPKSGAKPTAESITEFVKGKVSEYKELRGGVQFVDNIPKNASGKILRAQLKAEYS